MKKALPRPRAPRAADVHAASPRQSARSRRPAPPGARPAGAPLAPPGRLHLALPPEAYAQEMTRRLCEVLRARRLETAISMYELEMRSGVARETIARFERGECSLCWFNLARLVQALRLGWDELGRRLMAEPPVGTRPG